MTEQKAKQLTYKARRWAIDKGFAQEADDMAQDVLMRVSEKRKASVAQICTDYVRATYGRTSTDPRRENLRAVKTNARKFYVQVNDDLQSPEIIYDMNTEDLDFSVYQDYLESKDRAIVTLRFKWGMTEVEIADCFGITESRVSQMLTEIKKKLAQTIVEKSK